MQRSEGMQRTSAQHRIRVALAGMVRVHRDALKAALMAASDFDVVCCGHAESNGHVGARVDVDVMVMDAGAVEEPSMVRLLERLDRRTSLVALGVWPADGAYFQRLGFAACLGPEASIAELVATVGSAVTAPRRSPHNPRPARDPLAVLTSRELQVLVLIGEGLTNSDIGSRLSIEVATVKNHVHHVLAKLGVRSRGEAAHWLRHCAGISLQDRHAAWPVAH